jgi:hypothetical protein
LSCRAFGAAAIFSTTILLAACGGGGGDSVSLKSAVCANYQYQQDAQAAYRAGATQLDGDNDGIACEALPSRPAGAPAASYPFEPVFARAMTNGIALSGTAIDLAGTYNFALTIVPAADELFEFVIRNKAFEIRTMTLNGGVVSTDTTDIYFSLNPYVPRGAKYSDGSYAVQFGITGFLPSSARVGETGPLGTLSVYTDSGKTILKSTTQSSWTMEAGTANTAYGCINGIERDTMGTFVGSTASCYRIDTGGNVLGLRFTINLSGKTLVFH